MRIGPEMSKVTSTATAPTSTFRIPRNVLCPGESRGRIAYVIQLVVTDLDGTLWDSRKHVPSETISAIAELRARNIEVLAATARGPRSTFATFGQIGIDMPAVLCNGAMGRFSDGTSFHQT